MKWFLFLVILSPSNIDGQAVFLHKRVDTEWVCVTEGALTKDELEQSDPETKVHAFCVEEKDLLSIKK